MVNKNVSKPNKNAPNQCNANHQHPHSKFCFRFPIIYFFLSQTLRCEDGYLKVMVKAKAKMDVMVMEVVVRVTWLGPMGV